MGSISKPGEYPLTRLLRSNAPLLPSTPTPQKLFNTIRQAILEASEFIDLSFENISAESGLQVTDSLGEDADIENACPRINYNSYTQTLDIRIMPTLIHDAHQPWIVKEMSQPDACILPNNQSLPCIVIETGWPESWAKLSRDKDLWLQGGSLEVQLVLLIKWSKVSNNTVRGTIDVYGRDSAGMRLLQTEAIFPVPANSTTQTIPITRKQFLGVNLPTGRNPADIYQLSLDRFRDIAEVNIRRKGLTPHDRAGDLK
ncbi:conserved hypothetical protein [Microsporum canis CBS 113480]|uniref:Uncharacterized protein n=1 Tax=Arthroderma otae (strain ATCC MYA-4605 / CBS 113480) TaxID=554155 RepID=C5FML4_ARTOC|nr:conserved hypothetical protein [Microsporum canis CBS 113480]EEQ31117.1 conserved hypothetical protein [Microsporum canis CBS 113480]